MATIIQRETRQGTRWQVQVRLSGMKPLVKTCETEVEAKALAKTLEEKARASLNQTVHRPAMDLQTYYATNFRSVIDGYLETSLIDEKNKRLLRVVRGHIPPHAKMADVHRQFAKNYLDTLLNKKSRKGTLYKPGTVASHFSMLNKVCQWHAEVSLVPYRKPCFTTDMFPAGWAVPRDQRVLKHQQKALLSATRKVERANKTHRSRSFNMRMLILFALETAARQQELVLAEWSEFDLESGLWTIPAAHEKTKRGRIVPLSYRARRILKNLMKINGNNKTVFKGTNGDRVDSIARRFHIIAKTAKLSIRFHDLRHEAITRLVKRHPTLPPLTLMKIVGHSSLEMLDRYYNPGADELKGLFG